MTQLDRRYRFIREIARGEHAVMHAAEHLFTGRHVTVRLLSQSGLSDPCLRGRLLGEARRLGRVRHRTVIDLVDAGEDDAHGPYLVTELLEGRALDGLLAVRPTLPLAEAVDIVIPVAVALVAAHGAATYHEGLFPGSIWLPSMGARLAEARLGREAPIAKLADFGVAPNPSSLVGGPLAALGYAAPERLSGGETDAASDVHALGAILFECLTGALPGSLSLEERRDLMAGCMPAEAASAIDRALAPRPDRFAKASELLEALRSARRSAPPPESVPPRRRSAVRASYLTPVRLIGPSGAVDGRSEDVSEGGLLVLCSGSFERGDALQLRFALPTSGRTITTHAEVRWFGGDRGKARGVGVAFIEPRADLLEDVRAYVAFFGPRDDD